MTDFLSEPIAPAGGAFDTSAMARGEPGLPPAFTWRGQRSGIERVLTSWKESAAEGGRSTGNVYLRRHYYRLAMSDGWIWTVYFTRQPAAGGSPKARWYLYTRDAERHPDSL